MGRTEKAPDIPPEEALATEYAMAVDAAEHAKYRAAGTLKRTPPVPGT